MFPILPSSLPPLVYFYFRIWGILPSCHWESCSVAEADFKNVVKLTSDHFLTKPLPIWEYTWRISQCLPHWGKQRPPYPDDGELQSAWWELVAFWANGGVGDGRAEDWGNWIILEVRKQRRPRFLSLGGVWGVWGRRGSSSPNSSLIKKPNCGPGGVSLAEFLVWDSRWV